ncbi:hypothetical protein EDD21DRAFT_351066 [Dissophora ornata]|nr:hypothetical protein EDD21DRAFT_351066 [Dissophora ornata]
MIILHLKTTTITLWTILLLTSVYLQYSGVQCCGTSVHGEIAYRAIQLLSASVQDSSSFIAQTQHENSHLHFHGASGSAKEPLHNFEALIRERRSPLLAGSFFPDWGYNCIGLKWNDAAEEVRNSAPAWAT